MDVACSPVQFAAGGHPWRLPMPNARNPQDPNPRDHIDEPAMLDVRAVALLLACSPRHVYRLADAGRMPRPIRLGALVRWRRCDLDEWIRLGCPSKLQGVLK